MTSTAIAQAAAWEHLKRTASRRLVSDVIFATETGPRELKALFAENPVIKVEVDTCADCGKLVQRHPDAQALGAQVCCELDHGWHHVSTADMLACTGTGTHVQAVTA